MLRSEEQDLERIMQNGNLVLDFLLGATCHVVPKVPYLTGKRQPHIMNRNGVQATSGFETFCLGYFYRIPAPWVPSPTAPNQNTSQIQIL